MLQKELTLTEYVLENAPLSWEELIDAQMLSAKEDKCSPSMKS